MNKYRFISFLLLMIMSLGILCSCSGKQGPVGPQGEQGIQGQPGKDGVDGEDGHTPKITIGQNGNWYIDGVDTGVSAKGESGENGLSAYEIYVKYHPEYKGTEEEWINSIKIDSSEKGNKLTLGVYTVKDPVADETHIIIDKEYIYVLTASNEINKERALEIVELNYNIQYGYNMAIDVDGTIVVKYEYEIISDSELVYDSSIIVGYGENWYANKDMYGVLNIEVQEFETEGNK